VAFSALAVGLGLAALMFFNGSYLMTMGVGGALVVALAGIYALTFLPALLAVLGPRINALRIPAFDAHEGGRVAPNFRVGDAAPGAGAGRPWRCCCSSPRRFCEFAWPRLT